MTSRLILLLKGRNALKIIFEKGVTILICRDSNLKFNPLESKVMAIVFTCVKLNNIWFRTLGIEQIFNPMASNSINTP